MGIQVSRELRILSQLEHHFVIQLRGIAEDRRGLYILTEYADGGDFFDYLVARDRLTEPEAQFYAAVVLLALDYIHSLRIIYRDLKPENLVLASNGYLKFVDFGCAKILSGN